MKVLASIILYFIGGFLAGATSLILLSVLPLLHDLSLKYSIDVLNVLTEEGVKLIFLWYISTLIQDLASIKKLFLFAIIFGLGFSFFEALLILLNSAIPLNSFFTLNILIHTATSILLILFIYKYQKQQKLSTSIAIYVALAFFIHLCYNLFVSIS